MSGLETVVRQRPLASTVVGGDCYSLGYSVPHPRPSAFFTKVRDSFSIPAPWLVEPM